MDKENGERRPPCDRDKATPVADPANILDPSSLFNASTHSLFGGIPGGYGQHLSGAAYSLMLSGGRVSSTHPPPATSSYGNLGTLSVAASQAASLGMNPASAAWWTMAASQLAVQDYLARLQQTSLPSFTGMPTDSLMSGYPVFPHTQSQLSGNGKQTPSASLSKAPNLTICPPPLSSNASSTSVSSMGRNMNATQTQHSTEPNVQLSDSSSLLGGVRLPPDTEIIKYTSSIIGPKVPGTTNRGRKKTISLDPPSVSVMPTLSSTGMYIDRTKKNKQQAQMPQTVPSDYRESPDRVEVIKLPANMSNGRATPQYIPDSDAPLNLSLKSSTTTSNTSALQSLSSLSQSLGAHTERISRRKPGPKPRRVSGSPLPPPGASPSPSLVQLFAAADSPRPSSAGEENDPSTHHKDGRPRNLGRGISKPKKNTVASLLAQSRALGIKPGVELSAHHAALLKSSTIQSLDWENLKDKESEEKDKSPFQATSEEKQLFLQSRALEELKSLTSEHFSEEGSMPDISSDSNSVSEPDLDTDITESRKRERERDKDSNSDIEGKRQKLSPDETFYHLPLDNGWKRETLIIGIMRPCVIRGDVSYISPQGEICKTVTDIQDYLEKNNVTDLTTDHFTFSCEIILGDYLQRYAGLDDLVRKSESEMIQWVEDIKAQDSQSPEHNINQRSLKGLEKLTQALKSPKKSTKSDASKYNPLNMVYQGVGKSEKQEAMLRELKMIEVRKKNKEVLEKERLEKQQRKQQEREMKRQQAALIKEQGFMAEKNIRELYVQELNKQREFLYTIELERERRRQHMAMVKALDTRKRMEEREKKRLEAKAEKMASRERRIEQRRIEVELLKELRKPVEDMELTDLVEMPTLNRIPGLKLSGQAFSDTLMIFEFLHNFGETLGFDMESLPTLNSLQNALMGDEESEEELLSVMTHLIICAIEDPGIPNPARHTTLLGQSLKQADITHSNLSEILRIYLYANATGEVKSLTGVHFERDREKRMSDHHNNMSENLNEDCESGKNAAFFVALRHNQTWKMSEWLRRKPFLALNATNKASILSFLCHELLQNKAVIRQIDGAIETTAQLRRDRWITDTKIRKLKQLHNRRIRHLAVGMMGGKFGMDGVEEEIVPKEADDDDEPEADSDNGSEGTQPEEEEDKKLSVEELGRKLERLHRQSEQNLTLLTDSCGQLRANCYGQDRYWRRYWCLPKAGGVYVEAMESAEPDLYHRLTQDIKEERIGIEDEKENEQINGQADDTDCEDKLVKSEISGGEEEDDDDKASSEEKVNNQYEVQSDKCVVNGNPAGERDSDNNWFSIMPRDPCDTTSLTSSASAFRCGVENSELRIPVFPPPAASPSLSQCDSPSPAPLALTPEESMQLEYCKIHGLPRPSTPQPIPKDMRNGWWRIKETSQLQAVVNCLHPRGARERELKRTITRPCLEQSWDTTLKMCARPGNTAATTLELSENEPNDVPQPDNPDDWNYDVALRVDMAVLEQVEAMEDKVANASMQVKGWKVPAKSSNSETIFHPACSHPDPSENPVTVAKERLMSLEAAIERRYLKPPLGTSTGDVNLTGNLELSESIPKGLVVWREAIAKSQTSAQLSMALYMLEASIAWDKSIMKAVSSSVTTTSNCQFCHSGDNEDKLLLCDGCDKGYHTYCFKPKMDNIPDGDWYCYECMNKATGERNCIVCGKKLGRNLILCELCPRAYHTDCLQPSISKVPRGKWHCPTCQSKLPKKRTSAKRTNPCNITISSSPASRSGGEEGVSGTEALVSPSLPAEELQPESPPQPLAQTSPKKDKTAGKKMAKEMAPCRQLLDDLESHDEAWPFLLPVNTKQFPTYKKIIKNPMDLSSIKKRLMESGYKSREEFCSDVRLIFNNCETFNEDDSPVGKAGHGMRMFFETRWLELTSQKPSSS